MSKNVRLVRRYARALFEAAVEADLTTEVAENLSSLARVMEEVTQTREFLLDKRIAPERKLELLQNALGEEFLPLVLAFIRLVLSKRRENLLPAIIAEYGKLVDRLHGIIEVTVEAGRQLEDTDREELQKKLEALTGQEVRLNVKVRPELIGGLRIRMGDMIIDGTLAGRLDRLKQHLTGMYRQDMV